MSSPPLAMRTAGRHEDPHFHKEEFLFRRVPTAIWGDPGDDLGIEAVALPDMSVGRSKYGHPAWVRFDVVRNRFYEDWAIVGVVVGEIPHEIWKDGVFHFEFRACHDPQPMDYPHSEVRAFDNGVHIKLDEKLPEDVHLKFRERLLRKTRTIIKPYQKVTVRQTPPLSHILEPFSVPTN